MRVERTVVGQKVDPVKEERARQFRREMTPSERSLWRHLRRNQLAGLHFRRQQIIDGFIVDFYCHAAAVIVELDGGVHLQQEEYDAERDRLLSARGFHILRIANEELENDLPSVLTRIVELCHRAESSSFFPEEECQET